MKKSSLLLAIASLICINVNAANDHHYVGGDISLLPSYEQYKTPYYDENGSKISDVITFLHDNCGWNTCRVRLFVDPKESGSSKTGVVQDLDYVKKLGKRIKDAGMKLVLDFHYSDTWADPSSQTIPTSWKSNTSNDVLADTVYQYTKRCLQTLKDYGAEPDFVQIGNEISYGMLIRNNSDKVYSSKAKSQCATAWARLSQLLNQGSKAVREICPNAKIIIHTERAQSEVQTVNFYSYISDVDYDIIGLSYYCFWHGSLSDLSTTLSGLATSFPNKKVQIVETAYYYQYYPTTSDYTDFTSTWPATETGQQQYLNDLVAELLQHSNVDGLYYWFPEENGNGGASWSASTIVITDWLNRGLWNDNNHKALKGIYELKKLTAGDAAISNVRSDSPKSVIYSISGKPLGSDLESLPKGMYILNGKKIAK